MKLGSCTDGRPKMVIGGEKPYPPEHVDEEGDGEFVPDEDYGLMK